MKQKPAYCIAFLVLLLALPVLWLADWAEHCYWRKYGKLHCRLPGVTDGYHAIVQGRCRTL